MQHFKFAAGIDRWIPFCRVTSRNTPKQQLVNSNAEQKYIPLFRPLVLAKNILRNGYTGQELISGIAQRFCIRKPCCKEMRKLYGGWLFEPDAMTPEIEMSRVMTVH
ncbi:hypothetical protein IT40_21365 [Paracoccus versutus]|nr:hypothetical protein IT40_21365 [Paracoccus versutus]